MPREVSLQWGVNSLEQLTCALGVGMFCHVSVIALGGCGTSWVAAPSVVVPSAAYLCVCLILMLLVWPLLIPVYKHVE